MDGDPADAILKVAEEVDADLIVVGNKGNDRGPPFLLGSVPNKVSPPRPLQRLHRPNHLAPARRLTAGSGAPRPAALRVQPVLTAGWWRGRDPRFRPQSRGRVTDCVGRQAGGAFEAFGDPARAGPVAEHAGSDHRRGGSGHAGGRHRGADPGRFDAEPARVTG